MTTQPPPGTGGTSLEQQLIDAADEIDRLCTCNFISCPNKKRTADLRARAARVRESLESIGRAELTTHPQNRAVKAWLDDLTGPLGPTEPAAKENER